MLRSLFRDSPVNLFELLARSAPSRPAVHQNDSGLPGDQPSSEGLTLSAGPTPFTREITIRSALPGPGTARLTIHDATGRLVTVLLDGRHPEREFKGTWDGKNRSREDVAPGVYFVRLEAGGLASVKKIMLVK